jgi:hypothetical protein
MSVHKLTDRLLPGEADADLITALEDLTERARRGEITGLAWAGCGADDSVFSGWQSAGGTMFLIGASILALQVRYGAMMMDADE